jgi:hypothetical protein
MDRLIWPLIALCCTPAALALGEPPAEPEDRAPAATPDEASLRRALSRYDHEPSVEAVVRAAVQAWGRPPTEGMAARARAAGWVPRVSVRARRGQAVDLASAGGGSDLSRLSTDDDLTLEGTLTFELDRLVFRRQETAIAREARAGRRELQERLREVVALYFERRRLQLERDLLGHDDAEHTLRIAELQALLDIFTNGEFTRMIGDPTWKTAGSTPATRPRSPPKSSSTATP